MQDYNTYIRSFPQNLTAMMFGYKPKPNFTVENERRSRNAPKVDFGQPPQPPPQPPQQPQPPPQQQRPTQQPAPAQRLSPAAAYPARDLRRCVALIVLLLACARRAGAAAGADSAARLAGGRHHRHARCGARGSSSRQQALALQQRKGSQLQVLVVPTTQPEDIEQYAVRAFEQCKLGRKGVDDGVLLVVAKDDRRVRIEVGYGLEGAIPDATASRVIQEYLVPKFRAGDYGGGISDATAALVKLIDGEPLAGADGRPPQRARRAVAATGCSPCSPPSSSRQVARGIFGRAPSLAARPARRRRRRRRRLADLVAAAGRRHRRADRLLHRPGQPCRAAATPAIADGAVSAAGVAAALAAAAVGGGGGGGWSGGGGMSGGGGASGSW